MPEQNPKKYPMNVQTFQNLFSHPKPLIGMVHLPALPGSPNSILSMHEIFQTVLKDIDTLERADFNALLIENFGDVPFYPDRVGPETVAAMSVIVHEIQNQTKLPIGINVLRNDAKAALAVATITGCAFIRVNVHVGVVATDQGLLQGNAFETLRYRAQLKSRVKIFADVMVKHGASLDQEDIGQAATDAVHRGLADGIIVTGSATGSETPCEDLRIVRNHLSDSPVIAGSGVNLRNLDSIFSECDGMIVGTSIKAGQVTENPVDFEKAEALRKKRDQLLL